MHRLDVHLVKNVGFPALDVENPDHPVTVTDGDREFGGGFLVGDFEVVG